MYDKSFFITDPISNNAFSFEQRKKIFSSNPKLYVPQLIDGRLEDIEMGDQVVFEDFDDDGILRSCRGLKKFVRIETGTIESVSAPIYVFDNHNHAFAFWHAEKIRSAGLKNEATLIHIDGHKDARLPEKFLSAEDSADPKKVFEYTNSILNVGNFIPPAIKTGLINEVFFVLSEAEIDSFDFDKIKKKIRISEPENLSAQTGKTSGKKLILDIDLDFFAPELDYIGNGKKLAFIQQLLPLASVITFATSPFFIDQSLAISWLKKILGK